MKDFLKITKWIITRSLFLYLVSFLVFMVIVDYDRLKLKVLNLLMPHSYGYFIETAESGGEFKHKELSKYIAYYKKVTEYMPFRADAYGMLGFCYYQLGKKHQAITSYEKAIELNPHFFWFYYNLGLIHFKQGEYDKAIELFREATTKRPEHTVVFIRKSQSIYMPFISSDGSNFEKKVSRQFDKGYYNAFQFIVACYDQLEDYPQMISIAQHAIASSFPNLDFYYYHIGVAHYELQKYRESVFFFQQSMKINSQHSPTFRYLGLSLRAIGKKDLALKTLQRAFVMEKEEEGQSFFSELQDIRLEIF